MDVTAVVTGLIAQFEDNFDAALPSLSRRGSTISAVGRASDKLQEVPGSNPGLVKGILVTCFLLCPLHRFSPLVQVTEGYFGLNHG